MRLDLTLNLGYTVRSVFLLKMFLPIEIELFDKTNIIKKTKRKIILLLICILCTTKGNFYMHCI